MDTCVCVAESLPCSPETIAALLIGSTAIESDTDVQNRLLDSVGEGEGGVFRENSMYIIYSETDHQPRLDARDKCSDLVHWEDPEESGGEGGGRGDWDGEYM